MEDADLLSFILRGSARRRIYLALEEKMKTPAVLCQELGLYRSHVSRGLKELTDKGLVRCKNPKDLKFKFYELTPEGKKMLKDVKEILKALN